MREHNVHIHAGQRIVASRAAVTCNGKGQRLFSIQKVFSFLEEVLTAPAGKGDVGVNRHTAYRIDQCFKAGKIDLGIVVDVYAIQIFQCHHGAFHTVQAAVGQLVQRPTTRGIGDVVVSGGIDQEDLVSLGIDNRQDVHIAAAVIQAAAAGIGTA